MQKKTQKHRIINTSGDIGNRVIVYENDVNSPPIIFVAGWASSLSTWRFFIPTLNNYAQVYYFETREKPFTKRKVKRLSLDINAMSYDLYTFINNQFSGDYILVGASVGASTIINSYNNLNNKPKAIVLITPNNKISLPSFFYIIQHCPSFIIKLIKPILLKAIKKFSYNKDGHRIEGLVNAMSIAELDVIRKSAVALKKMDLIKKNIIMNHPVLVIATQNDGIHNPEDARYYSTSINNSSIKIFKSFTEVHSSICAKEIINWLKSQLR